MSALPILIIVGVSVLWMVWTVRLALRARRGPGASLDAYTKHDAAIGGLSRFAAAAAFGIGANFLPQYPQQMWIGGIAACLMISVCETRWPRPSGQVRTTPIVSRGIRELLPRTGVVVAILGLTSALATIAVCWMLGDNPGGRTVSANVDVPGNGRDYVVTTDGFPGWPAGLLALIGIGALLVVAALVSRVIVGRAALPGIDPVADIEFRRSNLDRLLRTVAAISFATTGAFVGIATSTYATVTQLADPTRPFQRPYEWVMWTALIAGFASIEVGRIRPRKLAKTSVGATP